jgi:adenylosuccinate synthase
MSNEAIIGTGFGDCGKGLTTDYLCSQALNPLVIRFSGGQQAGHTVVLNGVRHVFSNFGSGTLRGVPTYWSQFCTIDPIGIVNELDSLLKKGVSPLLYIDERCPVTTPYEMFHNRKNDTKNGTCGVGVGSTIQREEDHYSLTFRDLFIPFVFNTKIEAIKHYYNYQVNLKLDRFLECVLSITHSKNIQSTYSFPCHDYECIFEGSQGLLLDQNIGFFPNVTRSNTGTKNILKIYDRPWVNLVMRAYQTRHGIGKMSNTNIPNNIKRDPNETNITNKYQSFFRRSLLDLDLLLYGISKDDYIRTTKRKSLFITCLDHIVDEYRFTHQGEIVYCCDETEFVEKISNILGIKDVYVSRSNESKNIEKFH